jgi:hypothetical protein
MTKTHKPGRSTERLGQFPGLSTEEKQKIQKQLNLRTTTMLVVLLLEKTKVPSKNPPLYSPPVEDLHLLQDGLAAKLFEENSQGKIIRSTPKELLAVFWDPIFAMESAGRFINQIKPPFGQGPVPGYKISLSLGQVKSGHSSTGQGLEEDLMGHCLNQVYEMNRMSDPEEFSSAKHYGISSCPGSPRNRFTSSPLTAITSSKAKKTIWKFTSLD